MPKKFKKYEDGDLKKLQGDLVFVWKKLDELCKAHHIKYFAVGGTLLGAIRHEGFIPWDDDLDLGMLYEDYIKFINIPEEEYKRFGLYAPEKNPGAYYSFVTKFFYRDSRFITPIALADGKDGMGVFVEIFPYYNFPSDKRKFAFVKKKIKIIKALYTVVTCDRIIVMEQGLAGRIKYIQKAAVKALTKICGINAAWLAKRYDRILGEYKNEETEYVVSAADTIGLYKKEWYETVTESKFEGGLMPIPKTWLPYVRYNYGEDYMKLPPESERWNQAAEYIRFVDGTEMK